MLLNALAVTTLYVPQVIGSLVFPDSLGRQDWLPIAAVFLGYSVGNAITAFNLIPVFSQSTRNHLGFLAGAMLLTATAPTVTVFAVCCLLIGLGASVASRLLGMVACRARPDQTGTAIASCVVTALLSVLGMRMWGEQLASTVGWRAMFALMSTPFICWFIAGRVEFNGRRATLVQDAPVDAVKLLCASAMLRRGLANQALAFATYNAAWVLLAAQLAPGERISASFWGSAAGITSLVVAGIAMARGHSRFLQRLGNAAMLIPGCPLLLLAYAGLTGAESRTNPGLLMALSLGMAFIDAGMQLTLVGNQTRVQAIAPDSTGRMASLLTISGSMGAAIAGGASRWLWQHSGWQAALSLIAITAAGGLIVACAPQYTRDLNSRRRRERQGSSPACVAFRLQTTFPAIRRKGDRNFCGNLVSKGTKT